MNKKYSRFFTYIKPILKNRKVQDYGPLIFSLITSAIFAYFAIKPTLSTIVSLQKALDQQKDIFNKLEQKTETLSLGKKNYQDLGTDVVNRIDNLLPNKTGAPFLINSLIGIGQQHEATISGLQFQPFDLVGEPKSIDKKATIAELEFSINFQGDYKKLASLLNSLNQLNRLITIKNVNFVKPEDGPLTISVSAKTYYLTY